MRFNSLYNFPISSCNRVISSDSSGRPSVLHKTNNKNENNSQYQGSCNVDGGSSQNNRTYNFSVASLNRLSDPTILEATDDGKGSSFLREMRPLGGSLYASFDASFSWSESDSFFSCKISDCAVLV